MYHALDEPVEDVPGAHLREPVFTSLRPFFVLCLVISVVDCALGFVHSRTLMGPQYSSGLQEAILIIAGGLCTAQFAIVFILGGIVFRHWVVGQCVAILLAILWTCSGWCWHFGVYLTYDNTMDRFADSFGYVCFVPLIVLAGSCPLLIVRIGMCRARPKGISIIELFAILSFVASVLIFSTIPAKTLAPENLILPLIFTALGSSVTVAPASLLYFTATDERRGTQRFLVFAFMIANSLTAFALFTSSAQLPIVLMLWFTLLVTILFIGIWCMRRSGLRIPSNLQSPDIRSTEEAANDQSQFIWVIVGTMSVAFAVNIIARLLEAEPQ